MKTVTCKTFIALLFFTSLTACSNKNDHKQTMHSATRVTINQRQIEMAYDAPSYFEQQETRPLQPTKTYADYPYIKEQTQQFSLVHTPLASHGNFVLSVRETFDDYTQIELQFNQRLLYSNDQHKASFGGFCQMPQTHALVFFIDSVNEGISTYKHEILFQGEGEHWRTQDLPGQDSPTIFEHYAQCEAPGEKHANTHSEDNNLALCSCTLSENDFDNALTSNQRQTEQWQAAIGNTERALFNLPEDFQQGQSTPFALYPIADQTALQRLIENAQQDEGFEVSRIELDSGSVLTVTLEVEPYFNVGYGFVLTQGQWYLWYTAGDSSKSFQPITELKQIDAHTVSLELCIHDCGWWGQRAAVALDFQAHTLKMVDL